jgi:hypothetical protein
MIGGVATGPVARFDGAGWIPMASGFSPGASIENLCTLANGDLIASAGASSLGGVPANNLARWNGSSWSSIGNPFAPGTDVSTLAADPTEI